MSCHFCNLADQAASLPGDQLVAQLPHSLLLLGPWQFFTGYCILVSRVHATELFELPPEISSGLLLEMSNVAQALKAEFQPRKINYELLGNQVPHIHWHIIPRYDSDPDHLKPAWIALARADIDPEFKKTMIGSLDRLSIAARIRNRLQSLTK